jgi:hypothetical protein
VIDFLIETIKPRWDPSIGDQAEKEGRACPT